MSNNAVAVKGKNNNALTIHITYLYWNRIED
jgi:hypothetical protein